MTDPAFQNIADTAKPGVKVWRIEKFEVVPVDENDYGAFYRGDSYIVLFVNETKDGKYEYHAHFWLGSESSQDEQTVAARKTVELDDALGGRAIQHRECEGHESKEFITAFKKYGGIEVLEGGIDSGFNHVEPDQYETRLLHVKGKRDVRTKQVELSVKSLDKGDVFILDKGLKLFLWMGPSANKSEKAKAVQVLQRIYNSRGSRPEQIVVNDEPNNEEFWSTLGGSPDDVPEATSDEDVEGKMGELKLYRVSDASGELQVEEVPKPDGRLTKDMLDSGDVFLLDTQADIYVWIGKDANENEKKNAMKHANDFIEKYERPSWCRVTKMPETGEIPVFKSLFYQWDPPPSFDFTHKSKGVAGKVEQKEIDVGALHKKKEVAESEQMVDDGSGTAKVWIIEGTEMSEYPENMYGQFFSGDSYVVQYTYETKGSRSHLLYYWLGRQSDRIERGTAAARVVELADSLSPESCTHIRLVQGKEPPHFCAIFQGRMIVHAGGKQGQRESADSPRLYHVKGASPYDTKAVEVSTSAENLNSGDCFVVVTSEGTYLWEGKGSNDEERKTARTTAEILHGSSDYNELVEGEEDDAFWEALGGKAEYPENVPDESGPASARLFHVTDKSGALEVEEIHQFAQDDLMDDDVMILDTYSQVFVWIGSEANENEKKNGMQIAEDYVKKATDGRDEDTPIVEVHSGEEPRMFTCNFIGWDDSKSSKFVDPYEQKMKELREEQEKHAEEERKREEELSKSRMAAINQVEEKEAGGATSATSGQEASASNDDDHVITSEKLQEQSRGSGDERPFDQKLDLETLQNARPGGEYNLVWSVSKIMREGSSTSMFTSFLRCVNGLSKRKCILATRILRRPSG
eukprot:gb/GECG01007463.1/.p1 GENE.gb/GECG01007463.1/~~gb/GECG01007463.1/.p1  ORF type:complete len:862 (+),score=169.72 gb/GECG01007463.1/:1-2586(+)